MNVTFLESVGVICHVITTLTSVLITAIQVLLLIIDIMKTVLGMLPMPNFHKTIQ